MEKELKKIGHNISLKGLVIHQVIKVQNEKNVSLKQAKSLIQCSEKEKLFIGRINNSYDKKSNSTYGIFGNDDSTFKNYLESYWNKTFNFYKFSVEAVKHYEKN